MAAALCDPLRLDDQLGRERRRPDRAHLSRADEVRQRRQRLVEVGVQIRTVHLVEVDVVDVESPQAVLDRLLDPPRRATAPVRLLAYGPAELRGEHDLVAPALERLPDD